VSRRRGPRRGSAPPRIAAATLGVLAGVGGFAFAYGDGAAYLSDDPAACANCHVMQGHLDSWVGSGHHHAAVCNDCHLPPDFVGHWLTKADNGLLHSLAFTTGDFAFPIQIKPRNARRAERACLACHGDFVHAVAGAGSERLACAHCHADAGHARR
jgi:cytochrome c nitrite reductase small subunit